MVAVRSISSQICWSVWFSHISMTSNYISRSKRKVVRMMTVFTIISYLCWYDYVSITIMPHLLVWIVQKCLKSWLILYFMKLSVKFMCLKVPPWRLCKRTCPALLISEFVSWMMMSLQSCTRGTANHRPHVSSCVLPQCVHPDISHRDNCWCNRKHSLSKIASVKFIYNLLL